MTKEPKELYNSFLFLRTGDKVDSPRVAYTLNLESVNIDCLEEEFEEKIEAIKNGKDVTIKLVCNKAEVVSPERIIEYAYGEQKQPDTTTHGSNVVKKGGNDEDRTSGDCISRHAAIDAICTEGTRLERNGTVAMVEIKQWCVGILEALPSAQPDTSKYEYHYDHTDCIWYRPEARNRCPVTCAQYRDGWNDAMNYIFRDGKGYRPYRRGEQYEE